MHQYAYGTTYANRFDVDYLAISPWEGDQLFEETHHRVIEDRPLRETLSSLPNNSEADPKRISAVVEYFWRQSSAVTNISPDRAIGIWDEPHTHVTHDDLCAY